MATQCLALVSVIEHGRRNVGAMKREETLFPLFILLFFFSLGYQLTHDSHHINMTQLSKNHFSLFLFLAFHFCRYPSILPSVHPSIEITIKSKNEKNNSEMSLHLAIDLSLVCAFIFDSIVLVARLLKKRETE